MGQHLYVLYSITQQVTMLISLPHVTKSLHTKLQCLYQTKKSCCVFLFFVVCHVLMCTPPERGRGQVESHVVTQVDALQKRGLFSHYSEMVTAGG